MLKNYFRTTLKYFKRNSFFILINLFSLIVGIGVCFFAFQYVSFELGYDKFNKDYDRIVRVVTDVKTTSGMEYESSSMPIGPAIAREFPEVEKLARVYLDYLIINNDNQFSEEDVAFVDSSLFSVFTFPMISGDPMTALKDPFTIVLSESAANRFFGTVDCIGKTLNLDGSQPAKVTGVMQDMPQQSHFRIDILVSMSTLLKEWNPSMNDNWTRFGCYTYLLMKEGIDFAQFDKKIRKFSSEYIDDNYEYLLKAEQLSSLYFSALPRGSRNGSSIVGSINNVYIFSVVAILILALACFNFINLTTALSINRAKEIGVRKVLGATKKQLSGQLLLDSASLCLVAFIVVIVLSIILQPFFNQLVGKQVSTGILNHFGQLIILFFIAVAASLLAGLYPALFLTKFNVVNCLKGDLYKNSKQGGIKKTLIVFQFSVSIIIIIFTLAIYGHLKYIKDLDLGFRKDPMIVVDFHFDGNVKEKEDLLKTEFETISGVNGVSISSAIPGRANREFNTELPNASGNLQEVLADIYFIDYNFLDLFGMELVAGRPFTEEISSDFSSAMIINETAAEALGYQNPDDVIGKEFQQGRGKGTVIGVVKNFHFESIHRAVQPMTIRVLPSLFTFVTFDVQANNIGKTITALEKKWSELVPTKPFLYFFFDDSYNELYESEQQFGRLFMILATIAIIISCLGLFAFAAFSMSLRTKEIGVRKVLGSSTFQIALAYNKDFIVMVLVAFLVSLPIAWYIVNQWLQGFAYNNGMPWWSFFVGGMAALIITLITVSYHTIKYSSINPIESLRSE